MKLDKLILKLIWKLRRAKIMWGEIKWRNLSYQNLSRTKVIKTVWSWYRNKIKAMKSPLCMPSPTHPPRHNMIISASKKSWTMRLLPLPLRILTRLVLPCGASIALLFPNTELNTSTPFLPPPLTIGTEIITLFQCWSSVYWHSSKGRLLVLL